MTDAPADTLAIAVAQLSPVPFDVAANADIVRRARDEAALRDADLVVFPAGFLAGCPAADSPLPPWLPLACRTALEALADERADGPALLIGSPWAEGDALFESMALIAGGRIAAVRHQATASAGRRTAGPMPGPMAVKGVRVGLVIGADLENADVSECLAETGAELLIAPVALPHRPGAHEARLNAVVARVVESTLPLLLVNAVGGPGPDVLDGGSFALTAERRLALQFPAVMERMRMSQWQRGADGWHCGEAPAADRAEGAEADYAAAMLGLRKQVAQRGLTDAVLLLGDDAASALAATLAVDALGPAHVHALAVGPRGDDAAGPLAAALGLKLTRLDPAAAGLSALLPGAAEDAGGEALQLAPVLLQALAVRHGAVILTPADRVALALGHAPRFPGTCGLNPLADLLSGEVSALAALRNRGKPPEAKGPGGAVIPDALLAPLPARDGLPGGAELDAAVSHLTLGTRAPDLPAPVLQRVAQEMARAGHLMPGGNTVRLRAPAVPVPQAEGPAASGSDFG